MTSEVPLDGGYTNAGLVVRAGDTVRRPDSGSAVHALRRRYHDAARSFDPAGLVWRVGLPAAFRGGLVCHNDPNLDNVVFRDGRAVALIDFDLACPGSAVWDIACASRLWAPLREEADVPAPLRGRTLHRLRLFLDAYGLPERERGRVADAAAVAHGWCYRIVRDAVEHGQPTFRRMWTNGGRSLADRTAGFLTGHAAELRAGVAAMRAPGG